MLAVKKNVRLSPLHALTLSLSSEYTDHRKIIALTGEWRNWQTRRPQEPVPQGVEVQILSRPVFYLGTEEDLKEAATFNCVTVHVSCVMK